VGLAGAVVGAAGAIVGVGAADGAHAATATAIPEARVKESTFR
jgi:hypothetical protein